MHVGEPEPSGEMKFCLSDEAWDAFRLRHATGLCDTISQTLMVLNEARQVGEGNYCAVLVLSVIDGDRHEVTHSGV
jgi:hypothetical protein